MISINITIDPEFYASWEDVKDAILEEVTENLTIEDVDDEFIDTDENGNPCIIDVYFDAKDDNEREALAAYIDNVGQGGVTIQNFRDAYQGEYKNFFDFAMEYADETVIPNMPDSVRHYFDYNSFADDLEHDYFFNNGYVFRNI